jgi:DNA topoisomerase-6 subunit B
MADDDHKQVSVAEFFEKNRHLLGFNNPSKALLTSVKEAVDNSLDACEDANILPDIEVKIQELKKGKYRMIVEDNGPGLNRKVLEKAFGSLLFGSKFRSIGGKQGRGQQGIGISAVILYGQLTTGKPAKITSRTLKEKEAREYTMHIDVKTNEPDVIASDVKNWKKEHGTRVEVEMEGKYVSTRQSPYEFIKQTAVVNPHAQLTYTDPEGKKHKFPRVVDKLPRKAKEVKPHPSGVEFGLFKRMSKDTSARSTKSFLTNDFDKVGSGTANNILETAKVEGKIMPKLLSDDQLHEIHESIKTTKIMNPSTDCLSPIGAEALAKSLESEYDLEFSNAISRNPTVYRGFPFQVEVAIGYGGELDPEGSAKLSRFSNKVPLLYEEGSCALTKGVKSVTWKSYGLHNSSGSMPTGPAVIVIHIASTWVPFTSESKAAVSNYPAISKEIKLAIQEAGRALQIYVRKKRKAGLEEEKRQKFKGYASEVAGAVAKLIAKDSYKIKKADLEKSSAKIEKSLLKTAETMYVSGKDFGESEDEKDE